MVKKQNMLKKQSPDNHTTDKVNVISNCLLGQYVGDDYVIAEDIKDELIAVKKVKRSVFQNSVFCNAHFEEYGEIQFEVTFSKNTVKNVAMSELFVLEKESKINGYIENTIRTKVGQYVDELENFIEKAYAHFNISLTEQNGKEYNLDEDISIEAYIGAKRKFNYNMAKLTKKQYNKLYKDYVSKRLELLKKINSPYTQAILEKFNQEYSKIEKYFLDDKNYKSISELLDKCIEDCSGINPAFAQQEKELMDQMKPLVDDFSQQAETIAKEAEGKAKETLPTADKTRMEEIERQQEQAKPETKVAPQLPPRQNNASTSGYNSGNTPKTPASGVNSKPGVKPASSVTDSVGMDLGGLDGLGNTITKEGIERARGSVVVTGKYGAVTGKETEEQAAKAEGKGDANKNADDFFGTEFGKNADEVKQKEDPLYPEMKQPESFMGK